MEFLVHLHGYGVRREISLHTGLLSAIGEDQQAKARRSNGTLAIEHLPVLCVGRPGA